MGSSKVLKGSNRVFCGLAGLRVPGKPVRSLVLNNDSYRIVAPALLLFPDDDMVRGHTVAEVLGFDFFAVFCCGAARVFPSVLRFSRLRVGAHRTIWILGKMCQVVLCLRIHGRFWFWWFLQGVSTCPGR